MPWEIYCHQMNFKFWNHNRFETGVIDFVGHGLSATFTLFLDATNWYHGLLWQLNNYLHASDKSSIMLSQRMYIFSIQGSSTTKFSLPKIACPAIVYAEIVVVIDPFFVGVCPWIKVYHYNPTEICQQRLPGVRNVAQKLCSWERSFIHSVSMRALTHFLKLKRAVIETMGMKRKASMHTSSVKADWSDSMEMIVQLAKKSVIRISHVLKQNKGWQIADSPCPVKSMTPISNRLWFQNLKFILWQYIFKDIRRTGQTF